MRRAVRRLGRMLGRRGAILIAYGVVWSLYGFGQLAAPQPDQRGLTVLLRIWPMPVWAWAWIVAGAIAITAAARRQGQDWWGFLALVVMVIPWTLAYLVSWWPLGEFPRGWIAAVVWAAIAVPIIVTAGWSEPLHPKKEEGRGL